MTLLEFHLSYVADNYSNGKLPNAVSHCDIATYIVANRKDMTYAKYKSECDARGIFTANEELFNKYKLLKYATSKEEYAKITPEEPIAYSNNTD